MKAFPQGELHFGGMELRDYFAAKVMQALLTTDRIPHDDLLLYSKAAYEMADAMMKARKND